MQPSRLREEASEEGGALGENTSANQEGIVDYAEELG